MDFNLTAQQTLDLVHQILTYPLFKLQSNPITLLTFIILALILLISYLLSRYLQKLYEQRIARRFSRGTDFTIKRLVHYSVLILGFLIAVETAGIDLSSLAIIAGFLSVGIGFGLQNITSNFISGLILLFERPIEVGDTVTVGEQLGTVNAINLRATEVNTWENVDIIIPNSAFVEQNVINWSHGEDNIRISCPIGVAYGSDTEKVEKLLLQAAEEQEDVLADPEPSVLFREFGDSSLNFELRAWIAVPRLRPKVKSEINFRIDELFREHEIEIPFPQQDVHVRDPVPVDVSHAQNPPQE